MFGPREGEVRGYEKSAGWVIWFVGGGFVDGDDR